MAVPVDINQSSCIILGVLNCLKGLVAQLKTLKQDNVVYFSKDTDQTGHISVNKLLQVTIIELIIYNNKHIIVDLWVVYPLFEQQWSQCSECCSGYFKCFIA